MGKKNKNKKTSNEVKIDKKKYNFMSSFLKELFVPLIMIIFIIIFLIETRGISQPEENLRLPIIAIAIVLLTIAISIYKEYMKFKNKTKSSLPENKKLSKSSFRKQLTLVIITLIYVRSILWFGFIIPSAMFIPITIKLFGMQANLLFIPLSVLGSILLFVLFRVYLYILLPMGPLEEFIVYFMRTYF